MAAQDLQFPAAGHIPQPRGLVPACGHHRLAIGRKLRATDLVLMAAQYLQFLPLATSHSRAVLSSLAVTTVLPSGENCAL